MGCWSKRVLLFPIAAGAVAWWSVAGVAAFTPAWPGRDALLMAAGPFTAVPLVLFAAGARRIRLSTLGFLQYLAPTLMLLSPRWFMASPSP